MALTWSVSRDQILHSCERRYYFQYLVRARINSRVRLLREIAFLKKLKNLYMWKGSVFHAIIADYLEKVHQRQTIQIDRFINDYKKNIEMQWSYSLKKKYQGNIREIGQGNALVLLEHEYEEELPETTLQDVIQDVKKWFLHFYKWGDKYAISEKLQRAPRYWIEPQSYGPNAPGFDFDNVQVLVKVDLAIQNSDGCFDIYDWKSSPAPTQPTWNIEQAELQVSVYQLWPYLRFSIPLNAIRAHLVYLGDNPPKYKIFKMDENKKEYILNLIGRSIARVKHFADLHAEEQVSLKDFDFASYPSACRLCVFKRLCQRELII